MHTSRLDHLASRTCTIWLKSDYKITIEGSPNLFFIFKILSSLCFHPVSFNSVVQHYSGPRNILYNVRFFLYFGWCFLFSHRM